MLLAANLYRGGLGGCGVSYPIWIGARSECGTDDDVLIVMLEIDEGRRSWNASLASRYGQEKYRQPHGSAAEAAV